MELVFLKFKINFVINSSHVYLNAMFLIEINVLLKIYIIFIITKAILKISNNIVIFYT